jgi:hypothetical protein
VCPRSDQDRRRERSGHRARQCPLCSFLQGSLIPLRAQPLPLFISTTSTRTLFDRHSPDLPYKPDDGGYDGTFTTDKDVIRLTPARIATAGAAIDPDETGASRGPGHEGRNYVIVRDMAVVAAVMDDKGWRQGAGRSHGLPNMIEHG